MKFSSRTDFFVPDGRGTASALKRTTHLCIAAHQDDAEIMAWDAISHCLASRGTGNIKEHRAAQWFGAVILTDGGGSPRNPKSEPYGNITDKEMSALRIQEQKNAASLGKYSFVLQLLEKSSTVKKQQDASSESLHPATSSLVEILKKTSPSVLYTHNPADRHDTHVATLLRTLEAVSQLPRENRPDRVLACEVWRSLDWTEQAVSLDVSLNPSLASAVLAAHDSQISGGKRYDLAAIGRRLANATFRESHATDTTTTATLALDLTELAVSLPEKCAPACIRAALHAHTDNLIEQFKKSACDRLCRY